MPTPIDGDLAMPVESHGSRPLAQPTEPNNREEETMAEGLKAEAMDQTLIRFNDGSGFVAQESKQSFVLSKQMFQATAQNILEKEGLADALLQLKSAGVYPSNLAPPA